MALGLAREVEAGITGRRDGGSLGVFVEDGPTEETGVEVSQRWAIGSIEDDTEPGLRRS